MGRRTRATAAARGVKPGAVMHRLGVWQHDTSLDHGFHLKRGRGNSLCSEEKSQEHYYCQSHKPFGHRTDILITEQLKHLPRGKIVDHFNLH